MRNHHSKSIRMELSGLFTCHQGNHCNHITIKGIHSCRVDGNLIDRHAPMQREQVEQNVRSEKSRENSGQV